MKRRRTICGRVLFSSVALSVLLSAMPCSLTSYAAEPTSLDQLEKHFFEHTYPKDSSEARIERLEKLVFGEAKSGDESTRLSNLLTTVPDLASSPSASSSSSASPASSSAAQSAGPTADQDSDSSAGGQSSSPQATAEDTSQDYPRVDALEQVLLGKTYKNKTVADRLNQLEIKAFKRPSDNPDLSERVSLLGDYVQKRYHRSVDEIINPGAPASNGDDDTAVARRPSYSGSTPSGSYGMGGGADQAPPANASEMQQVAWLEQHVYGKTFPNNTLVDRIKRLDQTVFPSDPPDRNATISMKLRVLMNAVELMHTSGRDADTAGATQNAYGGGSPSAGSYGYGSSGTSYGSAASGYGSSPSYGTPASSGSSAYGSSASSYGASGYGSPSAGYGASSGYGGSAASGYGTDTGYGSSSSSGAPGGGYSAYGSGYGSTGGGAQSYSGYGGQSATGGYQGSSSGTYSPTANDPPQQEYAQKHGHPLLGGLARSLLTVGGMAAGVGSMAARGMMYGGGGYGYGGYPGGYYGGYGNYGGYGYGSGYGSGFGYGGLPGTILRRGLYW